MISFINFVRVNLLDLYFISFGLLFWVGMLIAAFFHRDNPLGNFHLVFLDQLLMFYFIVIFDTILRSNEIFNL